MFNFGKILTKVFGSRNDRLLKRYHRILEEINALESKVQPLTDADLRARTMELREGLMAGKLDLEAVAPEGLAIIRESMDRHIGIRSIFNPDESFDPDQLDDADLEAYDEVQRRMIQSGEPWQRVTIPPRIYAAVRKMYPESRPPFRARCFDVQLIGGLVLYEGKIAEMATGEGKTFVAPLACFLRVLQGFKAHVVTVNDYLVRRDSNWVKPAFENLGMTVGFIQQDMEPGGETRRRMYECDITYGTNSEFGFDYLRDNMKERIDLQVQGPLDYAIVDEVDSILIDEARTPLIISGAARDDAPKYEASDKVARKVLELHKPFAAIDRQVDAAKRAIKAAEGDMDKHKGNAAEVEAAKERKAAAEKQLEEAEARKKSATQYYEVELDRKSVHLTHEGIAAAQDAAGVGSFFVGNNVEWPHLMEQAMRAHVVYEKDKDYVVERNPQTGRMEVVIVDEYTGRKMTGRQWSDGLHQACEAKERVPIKEETQTLATITLQNFFRMYKRLAGMTGTAQTEAEEFAKIYKLEVVTIPTNRPVVRQDSEDRVYRSEREKWESIIEEIKAYSDAGRPVLVGTTSVEKSEMVSDRLTRKYGVEHEVLNAKQHEREAAIVVKAGQAHKNAHDELVGNVTIATNMAGRGTDIKLAPETLYDVEVKDDGKGGHAYTLTQRGTKKKIEITSPEDPLANVFQLSPTVKVVGGLHVIGTERHTARRIDNQLRGRSGRQGDPGSSRFYISLQDELMSMFAGEWTIKVLGWLGMEEGEAIEDTRISKGILRAQKKVEERNFLARKNLLEYDEVMDYQRTTFYGMRQRVLKGDEVDVVIWGMIGEAIEDAVRKYVEEDYVAAIIAEWTRQNFEVTVDPRDMRGMRLIEDLEHYVKGQARNEADQTIRSTLDEFMGDAPDDPAQWDTRGLSAWAMSRFQVQLSQAQIRKMDAETLRDTLTEAAIKQIDQRDVTPVARFLEPLYAERALSNWGKEKFGIDVDPKEFIAESARNTRKPPADIVALIDLKAREAYARREVEYPVDHVLAYTYGERGGADNPYAADIVRAWTLAKYGVDLSLDYIRNTPIRKLRDELLGYQEAFLNDGRIGAEIDAMMKAHPGLDELAVAMNQRFAEDLIAKDIEAFPEAGTTTEEGESIPSRRDWLVRVGRGFLRRELTDLEQFVLIQIFDQTWKDHLYAMDMLKSSVGLMGFAEKDPRIVFKKEGYAYFGQMMEGIRDKVTDLIFRARIVGQAETRSNYRETAAEHQQIEGYGVRETVQATAQLTGEGAKPAPAAGDGDAATATAEEKARPIVRDAPKVGRNDPCPCGSGKKYKKCHGANVA